MQREHAGPVLLGVALGLLLLWMGGAGEGLAGAKATLSVNIVDAQTGKPTAARVRLLRPDGTAVVDVERAIAVMYGRNDKAEGYEMQPDGSFYVDGSLRLPLDPGRYTLRVSKGNEYLMQQQELDIAGADVEKTITLDRWVNMPAKSWYSGDDHIHVRRSPRENPLLLRWMAAEDIHIGCMLQMDDYWATYFAQYAFGAAGSYRDDGRMLTSGQEGPRTHELGHTISLAADQHVWLPNAYYHYDEVFKRVRQAGGVSGYAHQAVTFAGHRGMTMDVLRGKVDFLELLQFCAPGGPLHTEHYYRFLDLGFRLTAAGGSDFPWCGRSASWVKDNPKWAAQIGDARFYTYVPGELTFESWRAAFKAGRTFVSSGPVLEFSISGRLPGDSIEAKAGDTLKLTAKALGHARQTPLTRLEIVAHSRVIASGAATEPGQSPEQITLELPVKVERGMWIAARCAAGEHQVAHTTPIYIVVDGTFADRTTAAANLDRCEKSLADLEQVLNQRQDAPHLGVWRFSKGVQQRIDETRRVIADLRSRFRNTN